MNLMQGDCLERMKEIESGSVDLTVTSPPYDNLRTYNDSLDWGEHVWKPVLSELFRVTKQGCVVVWVVGDATIKGSETGTSFKQALWAMECGFNLHDTMIYKRHCPHPPNVRYWQSFEYMFVLSKGKNKTFNPLQQDKVVFDRGHFSSRDKSGRRIKESGNTSERLKRARTKKTRIKDNVWNIKAGFGVSTTDKAAFEHPAIFPEQLAEDHIISWSNEGDTVFDPFMGSGTTGKMALLNGRGFIGIEKDLDYFNIALERIEKAHKDNAQKQWEVKI